VRTVWAFIRLSRPHFLVGGWLLFGLGAAAVGRVDAAGYVIGQVMVTAAQITAHYVNEYADREVDRQVTQRTLFSGGSGVLPSGEMSPSVALRAAWVTSFIAVVMAAILVTRSTTAAVLGMVLLAVSWAYSIPPVRLLGTGWGEATTSVVVAGVIPLIGGLSQGTAPTPALWWSVGILVPIHMAMMLAFELPDLANDAGAGKRVVAVRIGRRRTIYLMVALFVAASVAAGLARVWDGLPATAALGALAGVPAVAVVFWAAGRSRHGLLTASAVAVLVLVAAGLVVGLV
jgi:4-hydroxybenzoate polyprenyltransferase